MRRIRNRGADLQAQAAGRLLTRPVQQLMGDALDDPGASRQAGVAGQHVRQPGLLSQRRIWHQRVPRQRDFWELQWRMLCTVCDHRGADVGPSWLHHG